MIFGFMVYKPFDIMNFIWKILQTKFKEVVHFDF